MTHRALADRGLALQDGAGHRAQDQVYQAVTRHPTAEWLAQQIVESYGADLFGAMMGLMGTRSQVELGRWVFGTGRPHRDRPGRIHMLNV
jgi:hypothetical protein